MDKIFAYGKERKVQINNDGYETFWHPLFKRPYSIHRFIYEQTYGMIPEGFHIHHKDENKRNNSLDNLEMISVDDHNRIHKTGSKAKYKGGGIYWHKRLQKWEAYITKDKKRKYLGVFPTQSEAYQALFDNDPEYWTRQKQLEVKL